MPRLRRRGRAPRHPRRRVAARTSSVLRAERGLTLVHPYDDPEVLLGNGSCGLEILEDLPEVDVVVIGDRRRRADRRGRDGAQGEPARACASTASSPSAPRRMTRGLEAGEPVRVVAGERRRRARRAVRRPARARRGPALRRRRRARSTTRRSSAGCGSRVERLKQVLEPAGRRRARGGAVRGDPDAGRRSGVRDPVRRQRRGRAARRAPGRAPRRSRRPPDDRAAGGRRGPASDAAASLPPPPVPGVSRFAYGAPFIGPLLPPPSLLALAAAARPPTSRGGARDPARDPADGRPLDGPPVPGRRRPPPAVVLHRAHRPAHARAVRGDRRRCRRSPACPLFDPLAPPTPVDGWIALAAVPAVLGYLVASVEARTLSTAVVGGRMEGRPLTLAAVGRRSRAGGSGGC